MSVSYLLKYTVIAASRLEAISKATALLRTDVRVNGVHSAEPAPTPGPFWIVVLHVFEDV